MEDSDFRSRLNEAKTIPDIFELVKRAVRVIEGKQRGGLMLGLADLGEGAEAWIGGYHVVSSNAIIMNSRPLDYIQRDSPHLYKAYVFFILLHEYIHTLGVIDERMCRVKTYEIAERLFGDHLIVEMAKDIRKFLPYLKQVAYGWSPPRDPDVHFVQGFDRSSASYFV